MCVKTGWYILSLLLLSLRKLQADEKITRCFEGSEAESFGNVTFSCPPGKVIRIAEAIIGRNPWMKCLLTEDDCTHPTKIFEPCDGQRECSRRFKTYSPRCGYITILLLSYTCIQTAPITKPTPPLVPAVGTPGQPIIGNPSPNLDQSGDSTYRPPRRPLQPDTSSNDDEETGLIVATIFASIITVFMLIVAIIMTIRRLLDYPSRSRRANGGGGASRLTMCLEGACGHVDKLPCFHRPGDLSGQESLRSRKSVSSPASAWGEDTVQTNSQESRRVAPIGQESSSSDVTTHSSRERDDDRDEETDNDNMAVESDHDTLNSSRATRDRYLVENDRGSRQNHIITSNPNSSQRIRENTPPLPIHQLHQQNTIYRAHNQNVRTQPYDASFNNDKSHYDINININNNNLIIDKSGMKMLAKNFMTTDVARLADTISFQHAISADDATASLSSPFTHSHNRALTQAGEFTTQSCVSSTSSSDSVVVSNLETSSKC